MREWNQFVMALSRLWIASKRSIWICWDNLQFVWRESGSGFQSPPLWGRWAIAQRGYSREAGKARSRNVRQDQKLTYRQCEGHLPLPCPEDQLDMQSKWCLRENIEPTNGWFILHNHNHLCGSHGRCLGQAQPLLLEDCSCASFYCKIILSVKAE